MGQKCVERERVWVLRLSGKQPLGRAEVEGDGETGRPVRDHDGEERHELSLVLSIFSFGQRASRHFL